MTIYYKNLTQLFEIACTYLEDDVIYIPDQIDYNEGIVDDNYLILIYNDHLHLLDLLLELHQRRIIYVPQTSIIVSAKNAETTCKVFR